jgi:hypothetical protein
MQCCRLPHALLQQTATCSTTTKLQHRQQQISSHYSHNAAMVATAATAAIAATKVAATAATAAMNQQELKSKQVHQQWD